jgi:cell division protein FtsQ
MDMEMAEEERTRSPEEFDVVEDESPYMRRPRAVAVRRGRGWPRLRWAIYCVAVAIPVGVVAVFLTTFALSSPRFLLESADNVQVSGNRFVSREEIINALGLPLHAGGGPGVNIFRFSLEAKREQVESIAWIRSAALTRILPNRVVVRIIERTPVAFVNARGGVSLVDCNGVLLERPQNAPFDFPVITGLESVMGSDDRRVRMALFQDFMQQTGQEIAQSGWMVSEADLADADDLKALLVQGRDSLQVHLGHENFRENFRTFLTVVQELRKTSTPLDSMDLRYRNQVVINPQPPPALPMGNSGSSQTLKE